MRKTKSNIISDDILSVKMRDKSDKCFRTSTPIFISSNHPGEQLNGRHKNFCWEKTHLSYTVISETKMTINHDFSSLFDGLSL